MKYALHLLVQFEISAIVALSLNVVVGYAGVLTLAHAAYFAMGGYAYAVASMTLGLGFVPALAIAVLFGAVASLAVSVSAWRLRGDQVVLVTLAVGLVLSSAMISWNDLDAPVGSLRNLTNGPFGISGIARPLIWGHRFEAPFEFAFVASLLAAGTTWLLWRLKRSAWGRVVISMRDDELAARALGKSTRLFKCEAFAISAGIVSAAGALSASYVGFLEPGAGAFHESVLMLSMVLIGGTGNIRGPIAGAAFVTALPELIRLFGLPDPIAANLRLAIYGILLVVLMHLRPQGLLGEYRIQ